MKKANLHIKKAKTAKAAPQMKQLVMAFHPASCRSVQNTISTLRDTFASNLAA